MQKYVNLVDLVKSFPTSIYLQKSASIQPRTSLSKFGGKFNSLFIRLLRPDAEAAASPADPKKKAKKKKKAGAKSAENDADAGAAAESTSFFSGAADE